MNNILIIGSRGQLGSEVTTYFRNKKKKVIGLDITKPLHKDDIKTDIKKKDFLNSININKIKFIIYLAALNGVKQCDDNPKECIDTNVTSLINFFESIKSKKNKKIFIASSGECEYYDDKTKINNLYGYSKYISEKIGEYYSKRYKLDITFARFSTIYGFKLNAHTDKFIPKIINESISNKTIKINESGLKFNFIHYLDCIDAIIFLLNQKKISNNKLIYKIYNSKFITLEEAAKTIIKFSKSKSNLLINRENLQEKIKLLKLDNNLKWKPKISFNEGIKDLINYYSQF